MRSPSRFHFALLAIAAAALAGCQSLQDLATQKPSVHVVGTSLRGLSLSNAVLLFDVEVSNPYAVSLPLADLAYSLSSGGRKILEGSLNPSGSIPAKGKQVIQVPATIAFASMMATLKNVKPGAVVPYVADFKLAADAPALGRIEVPFSKGGEFPVPAVPEVEMSSLRIDRLALDQTRGTVKLQVRNTNKFHLGLKRIGMSFALGGQEVGSTRLSDAASLAPGESASLSVPLSFSARTAGASLINLLRGKQIAYKVSGSIEANTPYGPISIPYSRIGNTAVTRP